MRIVDINTFLVLVRTRHFRRTAEILNTSQPAISARLLALENEFGVRLIERGDGAFRVTPEGEKALQAFQHILDSLQDLTANLSGQEASAPRNVRIGAIDSIASTFMPNLVDSLHQAMPRLKIDVSVEGTKLLVEGMERGEYDIIFAVDPVIGDNFRSFSSLVLEMAWAGSPSLIDPQRVYSVDDLSRMPIITFPKDTPPYRQIAPYFQDERVLASKLTSSNSLFAIINLLIHGFGVGAIPSVTIEREIAAGLLCPIKVSKRFPPLPIVATYQTASDYDLVRLVVEQARQSAADFCDGLAAKVAWVS
ncbi:LysR family transcriptional regulator [Afifella sp. IM 167]|nr:LysR family transcriptional regulator [Afifella sp. IM 167]